METFLTAKCTFRELMKIGRERAFLEPPEVTRMTTEYTDEKPSGLQIDWIASRLGIESVRLQREYCEEANWTIWPVDLFKITEGDLNAAVIEELHRHGMIPILAEQGRTRGAARDGFLIVLAEHALVAPVALAICRKHKLNYLFCFPAVVDITELQTCLRG